MIKTVYSIFSVLGMILMGYHYYIKNRDGVFAMAAMSLITAIWANTEARKVK